MREASAMQASTTPLRGEVELYETPSAASRAAAESFVRRAEEAVRARGRFAAVLTGGSSPVELYRLLATEELAGRVPWSGVHLFWGDERGVAPGHPRSNYGMAHRLFVGAVPIPAENVHRMRGELPVERAAREYAAELRDFFGEGPPRFDLVHLGVGGDGHVASLFPFDLPRLQERGRWVTTALLRELGEPRITLTRAALDAAARIEVLLMGPEKAEIARRAIAGPLDPFRLPVQLVRPAPGALVWLLSRESARHVQGNARGGAPG